MNSNIANIQITTASMRIPLAVSPKRPIFLCSAAVFHLTDGMAGSHVPYVCEERVEGVSVS